MPETVSVPASQGPDTVKEVPVQSQNAAMGIQPGVALIYVSEELASRMEEGTVRSAEWNLVRKEIGISSAERLFPHAGEFEPRTRAEGLHRWYTVNFSKAVPQTKAFGFLEAISGVQKVEPSRIIRSRVNVNDPNWGQMWGMNNVAHPGYDVNCKSVWDNYTMGKATVTVAVVDGGIQMDHPDLKANIALSGHYNYVDNSTTIYQHDHGTHVAGTISAVNNNGIGVTGVAGGNAAAGQGGAKLLSLQVFKTLDNGYDATASNFSRALKEAADKGAVISQNSWGYNFDFNDDGSITGYELDYARSAHENPERSFTEAVDYFNKYAGCDNQGNQLASSPMKGGVVIFAAGNENILYGAPANYDGCIAVGAINSNGSRASFSNYGDWVDVCAPGVNVLSTYINGKYASFSGTSMACPHVSGVAALVVSYFGGKGFTADELRTRLIGGAKTIGATAGNKPIGPLVDAMGAFQMNADASTPSKVSGLSVTPVGHNLRVDFIASGAYAYMVIASKKEQAVSKADYQNPSDDLITTVKLSSASDVEGSPQSVLLAGLAPDTDYYVAVVAYSYNRNYSALSDIIRARTLENLKPSIDVTNYPVEGFSFHHHDIVSVPVRFADPDGDAVSVGFKTNGRASLESHNGSAELYNFKLMCPLSSPGNYSSTIEVKDEVGATTRKVVNYTVLPNTPPVLTREFEVMLLDKGPGQSQEFPLGDHFSDPDGEDLFFRATSLDPAVAAVSLTDDGKVSVSAVSAGVCQIKVSAEDHESERVESVLTVLVRPEGSAEVFIPGETVVTGGNITVIPGIEEAMTRVRLISSSGVVVYSGEGLHSAANPVLVDMSGIAPGIYTIDINYKDQSYSYTVVKL